MHCRCQHQKRSSSKRPTISRIFQSRASLVCWKNFGRSMWLPNLWSLRESICCTWCWWSGWRSRSPWGRALPCQWLPAQLVLCAGQVPPRGGQVGSPPRWCTPATWSGRRLECSFSDVHIVRGESQTSSILEHQVGKPKDVLETQGECQEGNGEVELALPPPPLLHHGHTHHGSALCFTLLQTHNRPNPSLAKLVLQLELHVGRLFSSCLKANAELSKIC